MENCDENKNLEVSTETRESKTSPEKSEKRNIIMFSSIGIALLAIVGTCLGFGIPQLLPNKNLDVKTYKDFKSGCYDSNDSLLKTGRECFKYEFLDNANCYSISEINAPSETETIVLTDLYQGEDDSSTYMVKALGKTDATTSVIKGDTASLKSIYCKTMYLSLGSYSLSGLASLENIAFADTSRDYKMTVDSHCFDNDINLKKVRLGNSLAKIKDYAFKGCEKIETIELSTRLEYLGTNIFDGCSLLTSIQYKGSKTDWENIQKSDNWAAGSSITTVYCNGLPVSIK